MLIPINSLQIELLGQRINAAWTTLGKPPVAPLRTQSLLAFRNAYLQFDEECVSRKLSFRQRGYFLSLIAFGEYPSSSRYKYWTAEIETFGLEKTIDQICENGEFLSMLRSRSEVAFESIAGNPLLLDVTDTVAYPYNSGIQRVVRQLAIELKRQGREVRLVKFGAHGPEWADRTEEAKIYNFQAFGSQGYSLSENAQWAGRGLLTLPARFASSLFSDIALILSRTYHRLREGMMIPWAERTTSARLAFRSFEKKKPVLKRAVRETRRFASDIASMARPEKKVLPIVFGQPLIQAEVPKDAQRVERCLALGASGACRLVLIVYDLIPLLTPEYYADPAGGFVDYLRLFRVADAFCCISESVLKDTTAMLQMIRRERSGVPTLEFSHLGADFGATGPSAISAGSPEPMVLSVGTIEPRKNQILLLRAARFLHDRGVKLRVQFVGNPGWKSDEFYAELARLDPMGEFTAIQYSVTDAELDLLYRQSRFSVFCSHLEGFGLPVLESLARGKPVITSGFGSMKEIADTFGGCLTVSPDDFQGLAERMELLLKDDRKLAELRSSIRGISTSTWGNFAGEIYDISQLTVRGK